MMVSWWRMLNVVDRLYFGWFIALSVAVAFQHSRVFGWTGYLALHGGLLLTIGLLAWGAEAPGQAAVKRAPSGAAHGQQVTAVPRGMGVVRWVHDWYPLLLFIVTFEEVARLSFLFADGWQDDLLLRFEAWLFPTPPTVWFAQHASRGLTEFLNVGYFGYFLLLMIVGGALYRWPDKRPFRQVMTASVLSYLLCYIVFLLFPTEGPAYTLAGLHATDLRGGPFYRAVALIQRHAGVHGNAFPSSHVAAGLAAFLFAWRYLPKLGAVLTPVVLLLCAGAVYDRYHYVSDVIAGLLMGGAATGVVLSAQAFRAGLARLRREAGGCVSHRQLQRRRT